MTARKLHPAARIASRLRRRYSQEDMLVLADWCEEHGLFGTAALLEKGEASTTSWHAVELLADSMGCRPPKRRPTWFEWSGVKAASLEKLAMNAAYGKQQPDVGRRELLGFSSEIPPHEVRSVFTTVVNQFRPDRLIVSPTCAEDVMILDLQVNGNSTFHQPVSGSLFLFESSGGVLHLPVANTGDIITLHVENRRAEPIEFRSALYGFASEEPDQSSPWSPASSSRW